MPLEGRATRTDACNISGRAVWLRIKAAVAWGEMSSRSRKPAPATLGHLKDQDVDVLTRRNSCGDNAPCWRWE